MRLRSTLIAVVASLVCAATATLASSIPYFTGPPGQLDAYSLVNQLIQEINALGGIGVAQPFTKGDLLVASSTSQIIDSQKFGANGGASFSGGAIPAFNNCFFNDNDSCVTENLRARERLFVGNAVLMTDNQITCCANTALSNSQMSGDYVARDAQLAVISDRGLIGISGSSVVSSENTRGPAIGIAGYGLNNSTGSGMSTLAWGSYSQCDNQPVVITTTQCFGTEIDAVNYGTNQSGDAYGTGYGAFGAWIAAGGAQNPTNPSNAAIAIVPNGTTFNTGINIVDGSLTKTGGASVAMSMGQGAELIWYISGGLPGATIQSTVSTSGDSMRLLFVDNAVEFLGQNGTGVANFLHSFNAVNGFLFEDATTGNPAILRSGAGGSDTNTGFDLETKGAAGIRVYPGADVASAVAFTNAAKTTTYFRVDTDVGKVSLPSAGLILGAVAPTVTTNQVSIGSTTAAASNCGSLASAAGCLVINVAGTTRYVPYY